ERMTRLISDLLDLASIEAGHLSFQLSVERVSPLVQEVLTAHASIADGKSIRLDASVGESVGYIRCDRGRIVQVLSNLIGNAIKFTPAGGAISMRAFQREADVVFTVTDTGPGIPEQDAAHIFESYWQAKPGAQRGVGLGLSIAKGLVEAQGGKLWLESRVGM